MKNRTSKPAVSATAVPIKEAKITCVEYGQVFNTGNYSSERIALRAEVNDENPEIVLNDLRRRVFWLSSEGKKRKENATTLLKENPHDVSIILYAEAVHEEEETRPFHECRRYYKRMG